MKWTGAVKFQSVFRASDSLLFRFGVFVVATPPVARFIRAFGVAPFGSAVKPLPHAPESIYSAGTGRIGVMDDAVLENESADTWPLTQVRSQIDSRPIRVLLGVTGRLPRAFPMIVVFNTLTLLLCIEPDTIVGVEVAPQRRCPWERLTHALLVCLQLRERSPRYRPEHHVVVG
jgi:hypothetical protein